MSKNYQRWLFRGLVLIACLSPIFVNQIDYRFTLLPDSLELFINEHRNEFMQTRITLEATYGMIYLIIGLVSVPGLLLFWNPARILFTIYVLYGLVISMFMGTLIASAVQSSIADLINILQGILLAIIYTAPVKHLFSSKITS